MATGVLQSPKQCFGVEILATPKIQPWGKQQLITKERKVDTALSTDYLGKQMD